MATDRNEFENMYDHLFPEYSDKFKIIVAEINGKIEASCSVFMK